jgi:hypothetical protein
MCLVVLHLNVAIIAPLLRNAVTHAMLLDTRALRWVVARILAKGDIDMYVYIKASGPMKSDGGYNQLTENIYEQYDSTAKYVRRRMYSGRPHSTIFV